MEVRKMEEGLLRQRRNLMVMCCLLFLLSASGATLEKVGLAGFEMKFTRPAAIFFSLWLVFVYYIYRYYVYFVATGASRLLGQFRDASLKNLQARLFQTAQRDHGFGISLEANLNWQTAWAPKLTLLIGHPAVQDPLGQPIQKKEQYELHLSRAKRLLVLSRVWLKILWNDTVVTDYAFPFVLAIFTLLYASNRDWQGSFSRIAENL
jgi:hypothetical protein